MWIFSRENSIWSTLFYIRQVMYYLILIIIFELIHFVSRGILIYKENYNFNK